MNSRVSSAVRSLLLLCLNEGVCTPDVPTVSVESIDTLVFQEKNSPGQLSQTILDSGAPIGSAVSLLGCSDAADPDTNDPIHCCSVEVIPNSYFFASSSALLVEASGTATLKIDGVLRHLRINSRKLEREQETEFDTVVPLHGGERVSAAFVFGIYIVVRVV